MLRRSACCVAIAGRAVVQVTDAQVLAAERHHGRRAEAETLGTDDRRLDDIESRLESAVGLQAHAMTQIVEPQRLMRLRETQFPRRAGVLDRRQRARAGATVIAGNRDEIRVRLRDTRGHGADAGLRDELHGYQRRAD